MVLNSIIRDSMIRGIKVSVDVKGLVELRDTIGRYVTKLPRAANKDVKTITDDFVFEFKNELLSRFPELYWTGELFKSIRREKTSDGYCIPMAIQGLLLEHMRPHFAPMWKPSPITGSILGYWAFEKLWLEKFPHVLFVKPHPWMRAPIERARNKILERLKKGEFHKTMERRGR